MNVNHIVKSYYNGQYKEMVEQIDDNCLYDVWENISKYLDTICESDSKYAVFSDMVIIYHHIKYK